MNKVDDLVSEMVDGMVASHPRLSRVQGFEAVFDKAFDKSKVALVSGGGSGHEPAHAGYVGAGMLAGAVCGAVFTSPTPDQIAATAKALGSRQGTLFVVKNYTGDVLNFQLAQEMLEAEGHKTASVLVDDDVALENSTFTTGRRGIAGTVLVHKLAGAKAAQGASLADVQKVGEKVVKNLASYGISLDACTVPANGKKSFQLADDEVEIGLGIHGEPGVRREKLRSADEFASYLVEQTAVFLKLKAGDRVVVLVNGLGATPLMEQYVVARKVLSLLKERKVEVHPRVLVGNYMTSLDMPGLSLTLLKLDDELAQLYEAPAKTPALVV